MDLSSLIDVIFILLLFLMVSIQFSEIQETRELVLPEVEKKQSSSQEKVLKISRDKEGIWYWGGEKKEWMSVLEKIRSLDSFGLELNVILELDSRSDFGGFYQLAEELQKQKIRNVQVSIQPKQ